MASSSLMNGSSSSTQMFDIKVEDIKEPKMHVYEQFKRRIFEGLDYRKREAAVSLHKLFRFIEKTVRLLGLFFVCF